jgi:hypothetical protein
MQCSGTGIKPGTVHIRAFMAKFLARKFRDTHHGVIARLDRATQYSATSVIEPESRSVPDTPLSRSMTASQAEARNAKFTPSSSHP